jgi:hypothetical protein
MKNKRHSNPRQRKPRVGRVLYTAFLVACMSAIFVQPALAASTMWDKASEIMKDVYSQILLKTLLCIERFPRRYATDAVRGLVLADSMELALQLMLPTGEVRRNYFVLDGNYDSFHFITNDRAGELVLQLLCDTAADDELRRVLSEGLQPRNPDSGLENDAFDGDGAPVLFAYTFDMPRIARFNSALQLHARRGTVVCFDFQADALRRYCCNNISIQTIDLAKFERRFFP